MGKATFGKLVRPQRPVICLVSCRAVFLGAAPVNSRRFSIMFLVLSLLVAAFAHHSNASYDRDHQRKLKGTVVEFKWTNPHIQIVFDVEGRAGAMERWIGEGPSPSQMIEN